MLHVAVLALCWFAFQCAVTVGATVLPVQGGRFVRPSPHLAYTYTPSGASPAQLASPCFGLLGWRLGTRASPSAIPSLRSALTSFGGYPTVTALGTSGRVRREASHLGLAPAPRAVSPGVFTALRAAMLRRRDTPFSPCDVYHRASAEPGRRVSFSSPLGTPLRFLTTC